MIRQMPLEKIGESYPVPSNLLMFHDWRFIHPSYPGWVIPPEYSARMKRDEHPLNSLVKMPEIPLLWEPKDMPVGIRIEARRPNLEPREGPGGSIFYDEGRYRMWYVIVTSPPSGREISESQALGYAESDDGIVWKEPKLNIIDSPHIKAQNVVHVSPWGMHGISVFRDPVAPPQERYKALYQGLFTPDAEERYRTQRPDEMNRHCYSKGRVWGVFGSVSPDGLHWTALPDALTMQQNDTYQDCYYDTVLKKYVAYFRMRYCHRRAIGRSETDDFRRFPPPEVIIWCDANTNPAYEWYGPYGRSLYPGTTEYHMMLPLLWKVNEDLFYTHMATSPEGMHWSVLSPGAVMEPCHFGTSNAGGIQVTSGLVELPGNRVGVMAEGMSMPHKYPFRPSHPPGGKYWATWPKERMVALVADGRGEFRTRLLSFDGNQIHINARTKHIGSIRIQVTDIRNEPLPRRTFDECDPITGDFMSRPVAWRGQTNIGLAPDQPVKLWFRLESAEVFALRFV